MQDILNYKHLEQLSSKFCQDDLLFDELNRSSLQSEALEIHGEFMSQHLEISKRQSIHDQSSFIFENENSKKEKKKRVRVYTSNNPNNKKGHWNRQQSLKYHFFLELNAKYFVDSERRKIDKVFKSMAAFIETREAHQCRSRHQKIQKKWGSFPNILLNLRLQNFNSAEKEVLLKQMEKKEIGSTYIFEEHQLKNEQEVYRKIFSWQASQPDCISQNRTESNTQMADNFINQHKPNCMCLMMSERYEDHLMISHCL